MRRRAPLLNGAGRSGAGQAPTMRRPKRGASAGGDPRGRAGCSYVNIGLTAQTVRIGAPIRCGWGGLCAFASLGRELRRLQRFGALLLPLPRASQAGRCFLQREGTRVRPEHQMPSFQLPPSSCPVSSSCLSCLSSSSRGSFRTVFAAFYLSVMRP